jgi:predicted membrane-bound dolichyl-phosphate-mannose-protein mannosyltransferase
VNAIAQTPRTAGPYALFARARAWLAARDGSVAMSKLDWALAAGLTLASFAICFAWVWYPAEKIFDEIYYARAGEEYLKGVDVSGWGPYEFTHPPLTKLVIALSMLLFGGLHGLGDTALGWRFLNVVIGALTVGLVYVFAKRLTGSTPFAAAAGLMLACDGFHFVQSRIATPEITVGLLSLFVLYALYRLWEASRQTPPTSLGRRGWGALGVCTAIGIALGALVAFAVPYVSGPITERGVDFVGWARIVAFGWTLLLCWLIGRTMVAPRFAAVPPVVTRAARTWWLIVPLAAALVVDAKWNGLLDLLVIWLLAAAVGAQRWFRGEPAFGSPFGLPVDVLVAACVVVGGVVYTLSYVPYFLLGHGFVDMVAMQHDMYRYHTTLVATHPYSSVWWQWPLLDRPILYYAQYTHSAPRGAPACCTATIRALPNPFVWLAGLISVPTVGWLAYRERNAGYALLAVAYLAQWLPWAISPRLTFEYHFFANLALIVLCNAIVLRLMWNAGIEHGDRLSQYAVAIFLVAVVGGFVYFYPVLAGTPISYAAFDARMWSPRWI